MVTLRTLVMALGASLLPASLVAQLIAFDVVGEIGVMDGDPCVTFGLIGSAAIDSREQTYILDELNRAIRVFDSTNTCVGSLGRSGQGPGEFVQPRRLRIRSDTLFVLDIANLRIERFDLVAPEPARLESIPLPIVPVDFCLLNDRYFVLADHGGNSIHEINSAGEVVHSFGWVRDEQNPRLSTVEANGYIACDAEHDQIIHAVFARPEVRAYATSGPKRWVTSIPGYRSMTITASDHGGVRFAAPESGGDSDVTIGATLIGDGRAVVQMGTVDGLRAYREIRSFNLDLSDGRLTESRVRLPAILAARSERIVGSVVVDYPRVVLLGFQHE